MDRVSMRDFLTAGDMRKNFFTVLNALHVLFALSL